MSNKNARWLLSGAVVLLAIFVMVVVRLGDSLLSPRDEPGSFGEIAAISGGITSTFPHAMPSSPASDQGLGPLPDLEVDPEQFIRSEKNPFRCRLDAGIECHPESEDPLVARSPGEARWMMEQGFPETALREKTRGWTSGAIRQEAIRTGSAMLELLALERQAEEAITSEQAEAVAAEIGRWNMERGRRLGKAWGGTYGVVSRAKALALAYLLAEAEEQGSGRHLAIEAIDTALEAFVWGDTLAFEQIQPYFRGGLDEFTSFSAMKAGLRVRYQHMRMGLYVRSHGVSLPTVSDIRIRPVPEVREVRSTDGRILRRWYGEP